MEFSWRLQERSCLGVIEALRTTSILAKKATLGPITWRVLVPSGFFRLVSLSNSIYRQFVNATNSVFCRFTGSPCLPHHVSRLIKIFIQHKFMVLRNFLVTAIGRLQVRPASSTFHNKGESIPLCRQSLETNRLTVTHSIDIGTILIVVSSILKLSICLLKT